MASLNAWRSGSVPEDRLSGPCSRGEWVLSTESRDDCECLTMEDECLFLAGGFLPHKKANRSSLRMFLRFFFTHATMSLFLCCFPFWIPKSTQLWRESTPSGIIKEGSDHINLSWGKTQQSSHSWMIPFLLLQWMKHFLIIIRLCGKTPIY